MSGSQSAAKAQEQASMNSIDFETNLLGLTQRSNQPYQQLGYNSLSAIGGLLSPGNNMNAVLSQLPGFQFQSQWGTKSAQNALASEGLGGSTGPLAKAISDYNNGLAGTYENQYFNQLLSGVNTGLQANAMDTGAQTSTAGLGATALTNSGNAAASGILGSTNSLSGALTGATSSASNALLLQALLGGQGSSGTFSNGMSGFNVNGTFDNLSNNEFG